MQRYKLVDTKYPSKPVNIGSRPYESLHAAQNGAAGRNLTCGQPGRYAVKPCDGTPAPESFGGATLRGCGVL